MHKSVEYDAFADIYDIWVEGAPVTKRNLPFYVEEYLRTTGPVVELGVGNGRIAIEAAKQGKSIIGVDSSAEMLKLCREQAEAAGVAHLLTLIQADFRDFVLPEPAQLIAIPFHAIGHLVTPDDKRDGLRHIYGQLSPGGRLIFDHFVFNPETAWRYQGVGLHGEYTDATTGHDLLLWTTTLYDFKAQTNTDHRLDRRIGRRRHRAPPQVPAPQLQLARSPADSRLAGGNRLPDRGPLRRFRPSSLRR